MQRSVNKQKYLHERNGVAYYIRRVPADVQAVVGAPKWVVSLDTKDPKAAEAAARALAVKHDSLIGAVRSVPEIERMKLAVQLAEQNFAQKVMVANVSGAGKSAMPSAIRANNKLIDVRDALAHARDRLVADGAAVAQELEQTDVDIDFIRHRLELLKLAQKTTEPPALSKGHQRVLFTLTSDPEGYTKFLDLFTARQVVEQIKADEAAIIEHERKQRDHKRIAEKLGVRRVVSLTPDDPENPRILTALDQWIARQKQKHDTARKYRAHVRRLVESVGNIPMRSLRKKDIIRFIDELETMPNATHLKESERTLPLHQLIERRSAWFAANPDAEPSDWPLISNASVRKHLESIKAFCGWYASRQEDVTNVARDVKAPKDDRDKDEYEVRAFTSRELSSILQAASALWGEQGEMTWLIRLGMLTGARLEELCQMARANVGEVNGILSLTLDRGKFEEDGKPYRRKLKNDASERVVPVHSLLIEAGFVEFAAGPSVRLFPSFKRSADRYGHNPSKAFHRLLRDQLKLDDRRVRFHSLRHTMITALHKEGVHPTHINAIVGHERAKGPAGGYIGAMDVKVLKDGIERVRLP